MARLSVAACALLLAACSSFPAQKSAYPAGRVLVLPPRDVVQKGAPHAEGVGTGRTLLGNLVTRFRGTPFEPLQAESNGFSHEAVATKQVALAEARRLGADYCLQLVLGEFRDAAAMTFRSDFVSMEQGIMWATASGEAVWKQTEPYELAKSNLGGIGGLLGSFAEMIVESITR